MGIYLGVQLQEHVSAAYLQKYHGNIVKYFAEQDRQDSIFSLNSFI